MTPLRIVLAIALAILVLAFAGCLFYGIGEDAPADPDDVIGRIG